MLANVIVPVAKSRGLPIAKFAYNAAAVRIMATLTHTQRGVPPICERIMFDVAQGQNRTHYFVDS
ncbi:hypothetical protein D3C85_1786700 [compost metagenome]